MMMKVLFLITTLVKKLTSTTLWLDALRAIMKYEDQSIGKKPLIYGSNTVLPQWVFMSPQTPNINPYSTYKMALLCGCPVHLGWSKHRGATVYMNTLLTILAITLDSWQWVGRRLIASCLDAFFILSVLLIKINSKVFEGMGSPRCAVVMEGDINGWV